MYCSLYAYLYYYMYSTYITYTVTVYILLLYIIIRSMYVCILCICTVICINTYCTYLYSLRLICVLSPYYVHQIHHTFFELMTSSFRTTFGCMNNFLATDSEILITLESIETSALVAWLLEFPIF
jgi:hypothetical protein